MDEAVVLIDYDQRNSKELTIRKYDIIQVNYLVIFHE